MELFDVDDSNEVFSTWLQNSEILKSDDEFDNINDYK